MSLLFCFQTFLEPKKFTKLYDLWNLHHIPKQKVKHFFFFQSSSPPSNTNQNPHFTNPIISISSMASIYTCIECGTNLNLHTTNLFPPDFYFEAGNKGTLSFAAIDSTKFRFVKEDKIRPFFETINYWGIQRKRTKLVCNSCGRVVGYVYDDGPPMMTGTGQFGFGPSQAIPRAPRYRFKIKLLRITSET